MALAFGIGAAAMGVAKILPGILKSIGGKGGDGGVAGNLEGNAGAGVGAALGIGQTIAGAIQRKKADALLPPSESVMERQMLQSIRRRRRAMETGTAGAADRAAIRQMGKSFGRQAFAAGGRGNFGQLAALQSQAMQNLAASYGQQTTALLGQEQQQANRMAGVARDLSLLRSDKMSARAEANIQGGSQNILAALGPKGGDASNASDTVSRTRFANLQQKYNLLKEEQDN
jgi:hypothetical protein